MLICRGAWWVPQPSGAPWSESGLAGTPCSGFLERVGLPPRDRANYQALLAVLAVGSIAPGWLCKPVGVKHKFLKAGLRWRGAAGPGAGSGIAFRIALGRLCGLDKLRSALKA